MKNNDWRIPVASGSWDAGTSASSMDLFCAAEEGCEPSGYTEEHFELISASRLHRPNLRDMLNALVSH